MSRTTASPSIFRAEWRVASFSSIARMGGAILRRRWRRGSRPLPLRRFPWGVISLSSKPRVAGSILPKFHHFKPGFCVGPTSETNSSEWCYHNMAPRKSISNRAPAIRKPVRGKTGVAPKKHAAERPLAWLDAFQAQVPPETWDNVPADGARNLDHYLYGAPKHRQ